MDDPNNVSVKLEEPEGPPRMLRIRTLDGSLQYLVAPPNITPGIVQLPAGHHPTMLGPDQKPLNVVRAFGFTGQHLMKDEDGNELLVLAYQEGHVPQSRIQLPNGVTPIRRS